MANLDIPSKSEPEIRKSSTYIGSVKKTRRARVNIVEINKKKGYVMLDCEGSKYKFWPDDSFELSFTVTFDNTDFE